MSHLLDHPLRYQLVNELHARPFPSLKSPCQATYIAIKPIQDAAARDRELDRTHLVALLDRFGVGHPQPGATHYSSQIGKYFLKWENHTEFVTYTIFNDGLSERPFDPANFDVFPGDWLKTIPGVRITSAMIRIETQEDTSQSLHERLEGWFVPESLAVSRVENGSAVIAGDFRIDTAGHMRFAVFVEPGCNNRRIGRIVQRLCEIETYKTMSMLGFGRARDLSIRMGELDRELTSLIENLTGQVSKADETLSTLLSISAELESLTAKSSFRFGATGAYETIVNQRIEVLHEEHYKGRQTFGEFMMRRFDPAMRTVKSAERRLHAMSDRALRAGELLRTQVDVERSAQNQKLLESMDQRAALQLRLQKTVEGLSVVAISYYAVNLAVYITQPFADIFRVGKPALTAILTPLVILLVWLMIKQVRQHLQ